MSSDSTRTPFFRAKNGLFSCFFMQKTGFFARAKMRGFRYAFAGRDRAGRFRGPSVRRGFCRIERLGDAAEWEADSVI